MRNSLLDFRLNGLKVVRLVIICTGPFLEENNTMDCTLLSQLMLKISEPTSKKKRGMIRTQRLVEFLLQDGLLVQTLISDLGLVETAGISAVLVQRVERAVLLLLDRLPGLL